MKNIAAIIEGEIRLNSNLSESAFGKTHSNDVLTQEGKLFEGKNFRIWNFEEVRSYSEDGKDERTVFYCGKNPLSENAKTLADYFELGGEELFKAAIAVINAITAAAKDKTPVPMVGAGGIFVDISSDTPLVLFLPENLFKYACNGLSKAEQLELYNGWINQTIFDLPALCFERAVIAYRLLTKRLPYASEDILERNADILDRKFLPIDLCLNGMDSKLAKEINKALKLNSNAVNVPGKKQKGKSSEDLTPTPEFPVELLKDAWELSKNSAATDDEAFKEKAENYLRTQNSKVTFKRNVRRNSSIIIASFCALIALTIMVIYTAKSRMDSYTSKGLTSIQTIQAYFKGINEKDAVMIQDFSASKKARNFSDAVGRTYVIHKQRIVYNKDNGLASPENWILYISDKEKYSKSGVYGVSGLKIDGTPYELDVNIFKKNEKPEAVTKEGNITLENNSQSVHKLEYYFYRSDGEEADFVIEQITEYITLTYKKDKWMVTDLESETKNLNLDCEKFKKDFYEQLEKNNNDTIKAVDQLRKTYPWLPSKVALETEKARITYEAEHPFDDFGF